MSTVELTLFVSGMTPTAREALAAAWDLRDGAAAGAARLGLEGLYRR